MTPYQFQQWKHQETTRFIIKELQETEKQCLEELLQYRPGTPNMSETYFYLRGKIEGLREFLNYTLEDEDNEDV